jgi:hypothetical protein
MPTVFTVQNKGYDLRPAEVYGRVDVLFDGPVSEFFNVTGLTHIIKRKLESATKDDYLILVGNVLANSITMTIWMQRFGYVNLLLFDAKTSTYVPRLLATHHMAMQP